MLATDDGNAVGELAITGADVGVAGWLDGRVTVRIAKTSPAVSATASAAARPSPIH
jgi:hypothetical protein